MPTVVKDVLYPGVYSLPGKRRWECDPADVRSACVNGNRMVKTRALAPPLIWEHDWNVGVMPVAELLSALGGRAREWTGDYAKHVFGYAKGFHLETLKGDPVLFSTNHVHSQDDADRLARVGFVSPRVDHDYRDGSGRLWSGLTVHHIAATPRPVQLNQMPVMLSQLGAVGRGQSRARVFLSRTYFLGAGPMADDNKDDKGGDKGGGIVKRLSAALANIGVMIPDSVTSPEELALALETHAANNGNGGDTDTPTGDDDLGDLDNPPGVEPAGGLMLSDLGAGIAKNGRGEFLKRLKRIEESAVRCGRLTVPQVRKLEKALSDMPDQVCLSALAGKQTPRPVELLAKIEADVAKARKDGTVYGRTGAVNLSDLDPAPRPDLAGATDHDAAVKAELERVRKDRPRPAADAKK